MKPNKIFSLWMLLAITALFALKGVLSPGEFDQWFDTASYLSAWHQFLGGNVDVIRTPLYPTILGALIDLLGQKGGQSAVIALQWLLFGIATAALWKSLRMCGLGRVATFLLLFFSLTTSSACRGWNNALMTESLSVSFAAIIIYLAIKSWLDRKPAIVCMLVLVGFLSVALRPGNIYFLPLIGLLLLAGLIYRKSKAWWLGLATLAVSCCAVLLYCNEVKKQIGVFTPTRVSVNNRYTCSRGAGLITEADARRLPKIGEMLVDSIEANGEILGYSIDWDRYNRLIGEHYLIIDSLGYEGFDRFIRESLSAKKLSVIRSYIGRLHVMSFGYIADLFPFSLVFILLAGILCYALVQWYKNGWKQPASATVFVTLMALSQFILNVMCAPNDFSRLNITALPSVIYIIGLTLSSFRYKSLTIKF